MNNEKIIKKEQTCSYYGLLVEVVINAFLLLITFMAYAYASHNIFSFPFWISVWVIILWSFSIGFLIVISIFFLFKKECIE